jgi:hypothetical protein
MSRGFYTMPRQFTLLLALATLSATAITASAQSADPAGPNTTPTPTTQPAPQPPAPIERGATGPYGYNTYAKTLTAGQILATTNHTASAQPAPGIFLRVAHDSSVRAIAVGPENTELEVERGLINISVHHPANGAQILVDLPGGQTSLLKDGLYTVNASTNTIRVLRGEAVSYPPNQKRIKVKEDHAVVLNGPNVHSFDFDPQQARADLIPYAPAPNGDGSYGGYGPRYPGDGFYADGYGYPFYAYGYPYPYPYPYYGYPYGFYPYPFGFGLGFDFYGGGFYRGGFRGRR